MKTLLWAISLCAVLALTSCNRNNDVGAGIGDAAVSSGTGGEGSGPTGTGGNPPGENPAAEAPPQK